MIINSFSQSWEHESVGNEVDGIQRIAYIVAKGYQDTYKQPAMQVIYWENSGKIEISFSNMGYTGCGGDVVKLRFDNEEKDIDYIWQGDEITTDNIAGFRFLSRKDNEGIEHFLAKMMHHKSMSVWIKDGCGQNDYVFPLTGSYSALNYVFPSKMLAKGKQELDMRQIMTVKNTTPAFRSSNDMKEIGILEKGTVVSAVKREENGRLRCYFSKFATGGKTREGYYQAWIRASDLE